MVAFSEPEAGPFRDGLPLALAEGVLQREAQPPVLILLQSLLEDGLVLGYGSPAQDIGRVEARDPVGG